jgi:glycogen debranching enzyme
MDIRDVQVIKEDRTFLVTDPFGDITEGAGGALGLYHDDTRFLSHLEVTLNKLRPLLLHSSTERDYAQIVELVYPVRHLPHRGRERRDNVSLQRSRVLSGSLYERLQVRNFGLEARRVRMAVEFGADFLDIFEVRGFGRDRGGQPQPPRVDEHQVVLGYRGLDGEVRTTTLRFSPAPDLLTESSAGFDFELEPGQQEEVRLEITPQTGGTAPPRRSMRDAEESLRQEYATWEEKRCARPRSSDVQLDRFLRRAVQDLRMLSARHEDGTSYLDAGVPWYSALFGRDSILTAYQAMAVAPQLAWAVLRGLAARQGTQVDDWREEEPGKILHELRIGELARAGEIPHTPYYGSADATPLWLSLLAEAYRWTGDLEAVKELWPNALAALRWIDEHGDLDGDGFVEYRKRSPKGLDNQGWKDSWDGVPHPDGTLAEPPIALVEVQGYVCRAKWDVAALAGALGERDLAERLEREANELGERIDRDFWMPEEGYYALALDGAKRQVTTITSNPGHLLWSGVVSPERAARVARRLQHPTLRSGWGIRTLATKQGAYDPIGYHTGSVWPHDNSLIAEGLKRYGLDREAHVVLGELMRAGGHFPYHRFPELYCGFSDEEVPVPVEYPVACRPQAWASGTPLLMLRTYGGLDADAAAGRLDVVRPLLPEGIERVKLGGVRVGDGRVDLVFSRHDGVTSVQVRHKRDLEVLIRQ